MTFSHASAARVIVWQHVAVGPGRHVYVAVAQPCGNRS